MAVSPSSSSSSSSSSSDSELVSDGVGESSSPALEEPSCGIASNLLRGHRQWLARERERSRVTLPHLFGFLSIGPAPRPRPRPPLPLPRPPLLPPRGNPRPLGMVFDVGRSLSLWRLLVFPTLTRACALLSAKSHSSHVVKFRMWGSCMYVEEIGRAHV